MQIDPQGKVLKSDAIAGRDQEGFTLDDDGFAYIAQDYSSGLMYVMPILFSFILVSLDNIQAHLENPFDQIGEDDVMINVEKFVLRLDSRPAAT